MGGVLHAEQAIARIAQLLGAQQAADMVDVYMA
jgi:hypothetical protein